MSPPDVLLLANEELAEGVFGPEVRAALGDPRRLGPAEVASGSEVFGSVRAIVSSWGMPVLDEALLARFPALEVVFYAAGSVKPFVTPHTWKRGVRVVSAAAANAVPVVEFTLAQVLLGLKGFFRAAREVRALQAGAYTWNWPAAGGYGSTAGLLALGQVGRGVLARLRTFDVQVLAYDPFVTEAQARDLGATKATLAEVFAGADVVSCHLPDLEATRGLLRAEHFGAMRPGATFINTARGAVLREAELTETLRERPDLTAVLDVTDPEPPPPGSALYTLPNAVLTPHIAGSLGAERRRMGELVLSEVRRWRAGEALQHEVRPGQLEHLA